jgi:hypothetical protein
MTKYKKLIEEEVGLFLKEAMLSGVDVRVTNGSVGEMHDILWLKEKGRVTVFVCEVEGGFRIRTYNSPKGVIRHSYVAKDLAGVQKILGEIIRGEK